MKRILIILRGILIALGIPSFFSADAACENALVSADASGRQGKGASFDGVMSADGRWVAFATTAKFLPEDTNAKTDVYLKDMETGALRLVSDFRGGDQPSISADGRFIVFRALFDIPRIRLVDRDGHEETVSVSFPSNGGADNSNRPADGAVISADGALIAYVSRPAPNNPNNRQNKIFAYRVSNATNQQLQQGLDDVGRLAISGDGGQVFFETADALDLLDTNGGRDIYLNDEAGGGGNSSLWISRPDLTQAESTASHSPAAVFDGGHVFFISNGPLTAADTDGRPSVFRADISGSNVSLAHVPTGREPIELSEHASPRADFLGFLTKGNGGNLAPFILDLATGNERSISRQFTGFTSAPVLAGDGSRMLFTAKSGFIVPGDRNGKEDVFLSDSPLGTPPQAPPVPVLNGVPPGPINQFAGFNLNASATAGGGALRFLSIDLDSVSQFSSNGSAISNKAFSLATGIYSVQARAIDHAFVTATTPATIIVMPSSGQAGITGTLTLTRTPQADGTTLFTATIRVDNRRGTATQPLRLLGIESSAPATMGPVFGDETLVPDRGQNILASVIVGVVPAGGTATAELAGVASAPETVGQGFQGNGWIISATLQEQNGVNFNLVSQREIFRIAPTLEEDTPGPNGGVPQFGTPNGDNNFNPPTLQSITISGPAGIAELGKGSFTATANFSNATNKPCSPVWSIVGGNNAASISPSGVLSAGNVSSQTTVTVRADFGGQTAQRTVNIFPVSPKISVLANRSPGAENGRNPRFKIIRSPLTKGDLTVDYTVSGTAQPGVDYTALPGTIVIPAGSSSAFVEVEILDDADFEGLEDVTMTLLPSPDHRLSGRRKASVLIADDETPPDGAVDATIKPAGRPLVGRDVYDGSVFLPQFPPRQVAAANGSRGKAVSFVMKAANRGTDARTITVSGAVDAAGFAVQYLDGKTDVSEQVAAGTFQFADVPAGSAATLVMNVTPTPAAAIGSEILLITQFTSDTFRSDTVAASVKRTR